MTVGENAIAAGSALLRFTIWKGAFAGFVAGAFIFGRRKLASDAGAVAITWRLSIKSRATWGRKLFTLRWSKFAQCAARNWSRFGRSKKKPCGMGREKAQKPQ
jgi:hypothetical protein